MGLTDAPRDRLSRALVQESEPYMSGVHCPTELVNIRYVTRDMHAYLERLHSPWPAVLLLPTTPVSYL